MDAQNEKAMTSVPQAMTATTTFGRIAARPTREGLAIMGISVVNGEGTTSRRSA